MKHTSSVRKEFAWLQACTVVLDAKDADARAFYEHFGFLRFADDEYRPYLPIATIAKLEL